MDKLERVWAAFDGRATDRVPVALWRHFPEVDQTAAGLARAVVDWQRTYDWDLVKVTPTSGYPFEDWGARFVYRGNVHGTREVVDRPIKQPGDWATVRPLDVRAGVLGREVEATRLIAAELRGQAPVLQTVFSPSYTASNLSGREAFLRTVREDREVVQSALDAVAETTIALSRAFLDAGADGIFFATQLATQAGLSEDEYRAIAEPSDRAVLDAVRARAPLVVLHAHGQQIHFDLLATYPVDAINWHDRSTPPALADGQRRFRGGVIGGIGEAAFASDSAEAVAAEARSAVAETAGRRLIVATGCVVPITTTEPTLRAARAAVEAGP